VNDPGTDIVAWTSWPARERPLGAALGLIVIIGFGIVGAIVVGHWGVGLGCALALFLALNRFYFPVQCEVSRVEARVRTLLGTKSIPLATVRRVAHDARAILLSSRSVGGPLDSVRGFILPLPHHNADESVRNILGQIERGRNGSKTVGHSGQGNTADG
jgi:hypothetical protein